MKIDLTTIIKSSLTSHPKLKENFKSALNKIHKVKEKPSIQIGFEGIVSEIKKDILIEDLTQIIEAQTFERAKYYVNRLIKGITEVKQSKINDLNLNRWKEYDDLITDSLWIFNKRDKSGAHNAGYWGNFIPQIPNQLLKRFTKKGDWVLDPFAGSGTTLIECKKLGRNALGIDLSDKAINLCNENLGKEKKSFDVSVETLTADSSEVDLKKFLIKYQIKYFQFIIMHPPYWDIIKFTSEKKDLSNAATTEEFLKMFGKVLDNIFPFLEKKRHLAVVIGDKYSNGEWVPLGFLIMEEVLRRNFKLKSIIVKNFEDTTAKRNQKELWRYRALVGGFYIFKHEYIFLFQKR
ncbi:DNA modification methylase [Ignavibacterium album JCM 16511]|uniref:Methyltransferase n=1 Tax=Ignavibacterium album (strain DSM 19864 / JCM 16511 / NBRC 101810 / Mat9-16) TaxID=945713 RepID=I0AN14_IGNAJ|nr:DNA methyltransferase [Ignavibacterium album]AFH50371.1 DNA modification methylase [Ignavibacterium album JCM 16511]